MSRTSKGHLPWDEVPINCEGRLDKSSAVETVGITSHLVEDKLGGLIGRWRFADARNLKPAMKLLERAIPDVNKSRFIGNTWKAHT